MNKRRQIEKSTQFKVEDVFGNVNPKDTISPEQITKFKNFLPKCCEDKF